MGYDRGDSFPSDFEPNGIQFGSKSKGKLSPRSYPIQCERKLKHCFLSAMSKSSVESFDIIRPRYLKLSTHIMYTLFNIYSIKEPQR